MSPTWNVMYHFEAHLLPPALRLQHNSTSFNNCHLGAATVEQNLRDFTAMVGYPSLLKKHLIHVFRSREKHLLHWNKSFMILSGFSSWHSNEKW